MAGHLGSLNVFHHRIQADAVRLYHVVTAWPPLADHPRAPRTANMPRSSTGKTSGGSLAGIAPPQ